jgi:phospholipid:diacylglycerol acyltransferase
VENLAVVNYDTNNLYLAPYDWRLSYHNLEERDGYFSKLKSTFEFLKYVSNQIIILTITYFSLRKRQKKKTVVVAHSMGCTVCYDFHISSANT